MKKIQFITSYPLNDEPVIRNRLVPYIDAALLRGYHVSLISTDTCELREQSACFKHYHSGDIKQKPRSFFKRFFYEYFQSKRLLKIADLSDADITIVSVPSLLLLFNIKSIRPCYLIVDIRDLVWEYISEKGILNQCAKSLFTFWSKKCLQKADLITVTNDSEFSYIENFIDQEKNILKVPNGVSRDQFIKLSAVGLRASKNKRPVVGYIGNIGVAQDLKCLIDVASAMPDIEFYIVGGGTMYQELFDYVATINLTNVKMFGRLKWDEVVSIYDDIDILYAQLTPEFSKAMPSKLYEYLSTGKFVIYGGIEQALSVLQSFDNNIVVPPSDKHALKVALTKVIDEQLYQYSSELNREKIATEFIREDAVEKVFDYLE